MNDMAITDFNPEKEAIKIQFRRKGTFSCLLM